MTRRKSREPAMEYVPPTVPLKRGMLRDPKHVKTIVLRMGDAFIAQLDELCVVNSRSRREIVEILIAEAAFDLATDPEDRINPL